MPLFADCQKFYVNKIWNIIYTYTSSSARFVIFKEPSCFCACMCLFCLIFCPKKSLNLNLIQTEALVGQGSEVKISCKQTTNHLLLWPYGCVCVCLWWLKATHDPDKVIWGEEEKRLRNGRKFKPVSSSRQISMKRSKVWPWPLQGSHYWPRVENARNYGMLTTDQCCSLFQAHYYSMSFGDG